MQPDFSCYCADVKPFDPGMKFVILIHPIEVKRRIATGRMSHLCLKGSHLIAGQEFGESHELNSLLANRALAPVVLYPGRTAIDLTSAPEETKRSIFPEGKKPMVIVIDGTWATARKMIRSPNLIDLPRVCFQPPAPSNFRVRKQPRPECYSTIEAIHHTLDLLAPVPGTAGREHDALLDVFDKMVEKQLGFIRQSYENPNPNSYRRPRHRIA